MLRLPKLFSDGCVLQQGSRCRIWGWTDPRAEVRIMLEDTGKPRQKAGEPILMSQREGVLCHAQTEADADGCFETELPLPPAGGPYLLRAANARGEEIVIRELYVGEVFVCAGQSNMELPMSRVCERFPEEFRDGGAPEVHEYKVTEQRDFRGPLSDHVEAEWRSCTGEKLPEVSAFAYFFGKKLAEQKKVPVGILNLSLGGTPAEAWMSREGLQEWPEPLALADVYKDDDYCRELTEREARAEEDWQREIARQERAGADAPWRPAILPGQVRDWGAELENFCGCIYLRKTFDVPADCLQKDGLLRFGTLVDSDTVWINGSCVGATDYRYPPRRYPVPAGLLREGENEILIRLVCRDGEGRSTAGQPLEIVWEENSANAHLTDGTEYLTDGIGRLTDGTERLADDTKRLVRLALADRAKRLRRVSLADAWEYQLRAVCSPAPAQTFISWMPTALYHGMLAPCLPYRVRGVLWYQGESNDSRPRTYAAVLRGLIRDWRRHWRQEKLPFVIVQLPNCGVDVAPGDAWSLVREAQMQAGELEDVAVTVNLDVGEDNDLHPRDKKTVAERAVCAVRALVYRENLEWKAPELCGWEAQGSFGGKTRKGCVRLRFDGSVALRLRPEELAAAGDLCPQGPTAEGNPCLQDSAAEEAPCSQDSAAEGNPRPQIQAIPKNPRLFELAGDDGIYYPAMVAVEREDCGENGGAPEDGSRSADRAGNCVQLYSEKVSDPCYVRYAWSRAPGALLLYGENGFCVAPFRLYLKSE